MGSDIDLLKTGALGGNEEEALPFDDGVSSKAFPVSERLDFVGV